MSAPTTLPDLRSATSLPASACGHMPFVWPNGLTPAQCGQGLALASLSAWQAWVVGSTTSGTFGPSGISSSKNAPPPVVFGEQVEAAIKHGWLDLVQADMEGIGYTVGAASVPAGGVGAPHIRQRLWFVADAFAPRLGKFGRRGGAGSGYSRAYADKYHKGLGVLGDDDDEGFSDSESESLEGSRRRQEGGAACESGHTFWSDAEWLRCRDSKFRPVEPGTFPLAHGATARVGRLRAYGNAIVPQVAAEVIRTYMECKP